MNQFLLGLCVGWLGLIFTLFLIGYIPMAGDMNGDNVLNITDLSILASVVNEQG